MIYLLYGQPASGKTTLGKLLAEQVNTPFIIDGDEFREMFTNKNYGREGREENIRNAILPALKYFPKEKILLTSECGFGHVPIEITRLKIRKLVEVANILRKNN